MCDATIYTTSAGWIPREQILDAEATAKVPKEYVVQNAAQANPPMFFYALNKLVQNDAFVTKHKTVFTRVRPIRISAIMHGLQMYPRLKVWYRWLNETQSGHVPGTYRWRGRNETTDRCGSPLFT